MRKPSEGWRLPWKMTGLSDHDRRSVPRGRMMGAPLDDIIVSILVIIIIVYV